MVGLRNGREDRMGVITTGSDATGFAMFVTR